MLPTCKSKNVIDGVRDEIVRLMELQSKNLAELLKSPELFGDADNQTINLTKAKEFSNVLANEITKAQNLELVVAVVGTMKAGKSTTINAIVGTEVLPNRSEAMTTLPTAIRHKAGQTEAQLTFAHNEPFNKLIAELAGPYLPQLEKLRNSGKGAQVEGVPQDVQALADAFLAGKVTKLDAHYVGRDAIYGFLHRLNDLVRLADLANVPKSPLDAYTQIDHFPLIEVEFSHLKSIEGYGNGKFTLLDTPGPNEATRGEALRKVLKEQLSKASAILAVIDYTQRGNDADKELRDFLDGVLEEKADRFYVVVNKFDQRGANDSSDTAKLCVQIASQSFQGKVKPAQVFPVSSQRAYYANAALRELDAPSAALPLEEEWVKQFGKLAFGNDKMAARMLPIAEEVRNGAAELLKDSLFSDLTKLVIQDGYHRAAFMAMHSAIDLVKAQSQPITNFLGLRTSAIGKQTEELKKMLDGLQGDVQALDAAKIALTAHAEGVGQKLQSTVKKIHEKAAKTVNAKLNEFFITGAKITEKTNMNITIEFGKQLEIANRLGKSIVGELAFGVANILQGAKKESTKNMETQKMQKQLPKLFDPTIPKIAFLSVEKASKFAEEIRDAIMEITKQSAGDTEQEFSEALIKLTEDMRREVTENYLNPIAARAEAEVKKGLGFGLQIDLAHAPLARSDLLNQAAIDQDMVKTKTTKDKGTRRVEQSGAWGWFKRKIDFLDNDWGRDHESFDVEKEYFTVDLTLIQNRVGENLNIGFKDLVKNMTEHIHQKVMPEINTAIEKLATELEGYRGDLLQSIRDKNKSQEQQSQIKQALESLAQLHKKVHADTLTTQTELTAVEQSAQFA